MINPRTVFASILQNPVKKSTTDGGTELNSTEWKIPSDLPYFKGHFPGTPIFPAVGILDASMVLLRHVLKSPDLKLRVVRQAKFLSPIAPDTRVRVEWQDLKGKGWQIDWKEPATSQVLATLQLDF